MRKKPPQSVAEINQRNSDFWKVMQQRFEERCAERPSDLKRAMKLSADEMLRGVPVGAQKSLEAMVFELEEHEHELNTALQRKRQAASAKARCKWHPEAENLMIECVSKTPASSKAAISRYIRKKCALRLPTRERPLLEFISAVQTKAMNGEMRGSPVEAWALAVGSRQNTGHLAGKKGADRSR